jgi:hypothetical protein
LRVASKSDTKFESCRHLLHRQPIRLRGLTVRCCV